MHHHNHNSMSFCNHTGLWIKSVCSLCVFFFSFSKCATNCDFAWPESTRPHRISPLLSHYSQITSNELTHFKLHSLHLTTFCLQYKPTVIACVCIHLACKWSNWEIPVSTDGKHWWEYVDNSVTLELLDGKFGFSFQKMPLIFLVIYIMLHVCYVK